MRRNEVNNDDLSLLNIIASKKTEDDLGRIRGKQVRRD